MYNALRAKDQSHFVTSTLTYTMTPPKRSFRSCLIKVYCSPGQKLLIESLARSAGAKSISDYALQILTDGNPDNLSFIRHQTEASLLNVAVYERLGNMVDLLQERPDAKMEALQKMIDEIQGMRRDIALRRLQFTLDDL